MSEYLYVFRGGQDMGKASASEKQANMAKWQGWIKGLAEKGLFKAGQPLDGTGKVLRGRGKTVTDGPYAEAKDVVGGYLIVNAGSLDEATELARGCPIFDHDGTVEVRAILAM